MEILLSQVLRDYMEPYSSVCEILDVHNFLTAYLDASFKGDVAQFALYTDRTVEETDAWYEQDTFDPPENMTAAYTDRYTAALKKVFSQCKYTVNIPQKESGVYNYTVDVTVVPNNSLLNAFTQLESGVYYSEEEVDKTVVELLEEYGNQVREPYSKHLEDGIFEIRGKTGNDISRVLYFFYFGSRIVLTNGFVKKTQKTPRQEIELAKKYRKDFLERVRENE